MSSILTDVKKVLGIDESYTAFDVDILMHTNTAFSILSQLGIGPTEGFSIEDKDATWDAFLDTDNNLNSVKTYIYLRVRLLFDSSSMTSFAIDAMERQIHELEWRLNLTREEVSWTSPFPVPDPMADYYYPSF